ncbi:MAG: hypothetical protein K8J08_15295 [Thermoanaerobaculia bacterium]|nr:hypothetical protein [Thermoanaerobaculia bacterium]
MTRKEPSELADRLIQADHQSEAPARDSDAVFEILLENELKFERRVRRLALLSWSVTFVCLVLGASVAGLILNGGGAIVEVLRVSFIIVSGTGVLALLAATITSLTWLFRSRTPTLRAIERRLADLERLLMAR